MEQQLAILYRLVKDGRFYHTDYSKQDAIDILLDNAQFIQNLNII